MNFKNIVLPSKVLGKSVLVFLKRILQGIEKDMERADRIYRAVEMRKQGALEKCLREGYPLRFF